MKNSGNLVKIDYAICPICKESGILEEKDYKLISYSNIYINENIKNNNDNIIIYKINENEEKIRIFGKDFVKNNKNKIKLEIEGKEYELMEFYNKNNNKIKNLYIKIKGIENITNMRHMFYGYSSLLNLPDISKWNTNNVTNMSCMLSECSSLLNLPDISK